MSMDRPAPMPSNKHHDADEILYRKLRFCSLFCVGVALLFHLIAFGAPYWAGTVEELASRHDHIGLWRYCTHVMKPGGGTKDSCNDFIDVIYGDWLKAAQSFMTLSLVTLLMTVGCFFLYLFVTNFQDDLRAVAACFVSSFITGAFFAISLACFGGRYSRWFYLHDPALTEGVTELEWAFYLICVATFLVFLAPMLLLPDLAYGARMAALARRKPEPGARQPFRIQIKY